VHKHTGAFGVKLCAIGGRISNASTGRANAVQLLVLFQKLLTSDDVN
jgi:hypothetical protein